MQAWNLAQILFEVHLKKKKLAAQNSNTATIFQDGHHFHKMAKMPQ